MDIPVGTDPLCARLRLRIESLAINYLVCGICSDNSDVDRGADLMAASNPALALFWRATQTPDLLAWMFRAGHTHN